MTLKALLRNKNRGTSRALKRRSGYQKRVPHSMKGIIMGTQCHHRTQIFPTNRTNRRTSRSGGNRIETPNPLIVIFLFCYRRAEENSINLNFPLALQTEILNFSPWTFGHRQKSSILKRQFKRVWAHGRPGQGHWQIGFETSDPQKGGLLTCAGGHIHLPCSIAGLKPAKAAAQAQELWAHDFYLDSNL